MVIGNDGVVFYNPEIEVDQLGPVLFVKINGLKLKESIARVIDIKPDGSCTVVRKNV